MKKTILLGAILTVAGLTSCGKGGASASLSETITASPSISEDVSPATSTTEQPSISISETGLGVDFSNVAKDQDMTDTTVSDWTIKASRYSYAGAIKLQNADEHIISPTIDQEGAINVKLTIFATGTEGTPWQFDIIGLNSQGAAVDTKSVPFSELPNQQTNAALTTWTLSNEDNEITKVKIVYVQKLTGANIGIVNAEIS